MKKSLVLIVTLFSAIASADCTYFIDSHLSSRDENNNGFHYEMDKVMSYKGYSKVYTPEEADLKISIRSSIKTIVKENFFTRLKDAFDRDSETDYVMKYQRTTEVKVTSQNGAELPGSGIKRSSGETIDNYIDLYDSMALESVKEGAVILSEISECRE